MVYIRSNSSQTVQKRTSSLSVAVNATFDLHVRRLPAVAFSYTLKSKVILSGSNQYPVITSNRNIIEDPNLINVNAAESHQFGVFLSRPQHSFIAVKQTITSPILEEVIDISIARWIDVIEFGEAPTVQAAVAQVYVEDSFRCINATPSPTKKQARIDQEAGLFGLYNNALFLPKTTNNLRIKVRLHQQLNHSTKVGVIRVISPSRFKVDGVSKLDYQSYSLGNSKAILFL